MEFQIDCRLVYQVTGSASFLFDVQVARNSIQRIISENIEVTRGAPREELLQSGQRLHRVAASNGTVELTYHAVVSVEPELLEPNGLDVASLHELPLEAVVLLYPSRFCQFDPLARFARRGLPTLSPVLNG